jgi:predicted dehydrogenase
MAGARAPRRIGIVGAGSISKLHLEGMARHPDRVQAVALCDIDADALRERGDDFGIAARHLDLGEMIAAAGLDAAIVCTPTHVRSEVVLPLLAAGIPVLCEKPFAETYGEAARIEQAAREAGVCVAIDQNFRRHFTFTLARDVLARGHLGPVRQVTHAACKLRRDVGWRLERPRYVMAVMSIHWFDGYRHMLGAEAEWVYCRAVNSQATPGGDDTAVAVTIQFGGVLVSLSESFSSFTKGDCCGVDCDGGGLIMGYGQMEEVRADGERIQHANPFDKAEATYFLLADLLAAVEEGRQPETSASDNVHSMRILEAAYRSLAEGRPVNAEEIR